MASNTKYVYSKGIQNKYYDTIQFFNSSLLDVNLVTSIYTVTFAYFQ